MFIEILKDIVYNNSLFYLSILIIMFSSFLGALILCSFKGLSIIKDAYYSAIFQKGIWNQSINKIKISALNIKDKSIVANLFLEGYEVYKTHMEGAEKSDYNSIIFLTKNTMKISLRKELVFLTQGFNILSFNSIFLPYASLTLALWSIINIFNTVDIGVLTLTMFIKPIFIIVVGLAMAGISSVLYIVLENKIKDIENISELFIEEFANKLYRNNCKIRNKDD